MLFYRFNTSRTKNIAKRSISVFLCFFIYFNSITNVYASTIAGWNITNQIAQGASLALTASKTAIINGASVLKTSTAKITPNASQVAKVLRGGAAGYALSVAVQELLGSVDWVLDPANNQIVYKPLPTDPLDPRNQYYYQWYSTKYASLDSLCIAIFKAYGWAGQNIPPLPNGYGCRLEGNYVFPHNATGGDYGDVGAYRVANPAYNPNATVEDKKVSLDVIAAKVISNAESSTDQQKKAGAQAATTAAAQDMLANDVTTQNDVETQLNTNSKTQTSEAASGTSTPSTTNPQVTNISLSFPVFCGWAPVVCEAAQTVVDAYEFSKTKAQEVSDYFKEEPQENTDNELEIDTSIAPVDPVNISIGDNQCPSLPITLNFGFFSVDTDLSPVYLCEIAQGTKPFFIALGFFLSAGIVGRRNT